MPSLPKRVQWIAVGLISLLTLLSVASAEWLQISGEKGFSFDYINNETEQQDGKLSFSQSLTLDIAGEFGLGYAFEGHLIDDADADAQLFFNIRGPGKGLQFGEGSLEPFTTSLTSWHGSFNGLSAYSKTGRNDLRLAYANPTGIATQETLVFTTGKNIAYLTYLPVIEGSLKVYREGRLLTETVDYRFDRYSGKIELCFFPEEKIQLELDYQYAPNQILGNRFYAVREAYAWGSHMFGLALFGSQTDERGEPILLGEMPQVNQFSLNGIFYAYQSDLWDWDLEIWRSQEEINRDWDYLDNMEGTEIESEAFSGSTNAWNWFGAAVGSARLTLDEVSASREPQYTREGKPSLMLDYILQRSGDAVTITHDFRNYRDYSTLSKITWAWYLNGKELQIELQAITSENNYYSQKQQFNGVGWIDLEMKLDPSTLDTFGFPDLRQIRYLKVIIRSMSGDYSAGKIYMAPLMVTAKSFAEQRWANRASSPGSIIDLQTVIDSGVPGEPVENHVLELDYNMLEAGWVSLSYQPPVVMDIANYHRLQLYLNCDEPLELEILTERAGQTYSLGTVNITVPNFWQEYVINLNNQSVRVLERVEKLTFRLTGSSGGRHRLRIDSLRVSGRAALAAEAYKIRGDYQSGSWQNRITVDNFGDGFQESSRLYRMSNRDIRNTTVYTHENWKVQTDFRNYLKEEAAHGYPLAGNQSMVEIVHGNTRLIVDLLDEEVSIDGEGLPGVRTESVFAIRQRYKSWTFDYEHQITQNSLEADEDDIGDSLTARFQRDQWWMQSHWWRKNPDDADHPGRTRGANIGFGMQTSQVNRWAFNGGAVEFEDVREDTRNYFWQTDFSYELLKDLGLSGSLRSSDSPADRAGLYRDMENEFELRYHPLLGWNTRLSFRKRDWEERDYGTSKQAASNLQVGYNWADGERLGLFYQTEVLENRSGERSGSRYGLNGELEIVKPWLTQVSAEYDTNDGDGFLATAKSIEYNYSIKNSHQYLWNTVYWGLWSEGEARESEWSRQLVQGGWEWSRMGMGYGGKLDLGRSSQDREDGFIWGSGGYLRLDRKRHQLDVNFRYQTYADYAWKFSLNYRYLQDELYAFRFQSNWFQGLTANNDLTLRADLIIYLR